MKILVLGGTRFVGQHLVAECLERGDDVTILYRGHSPSPFAGAARHVMSDRRAPTTEARAVLGQSWDAVVDVSAVDIDDVDPLLRSIGNVERYLLVSSCAVYRRAGAGVVLNEQSPTITADLADPVRASATRKLRCERYLRRNISHTGTGLLIARLGLVVGLQDYTQRLAYWLERALRGGDALVPMDPDQPMQLLDATDVAAFLRTVMGGNLAGIINVAGPSITAQTLIETLTHASASNMTPCWVGEHYAQQHGVRPWTEVPLWLTRSSPERSLLTVSSARAVAVGLTYRSLPGTIAACLDWHAIRRPWSQRWLDPVREQHLLKQWRA